MSASEMTYIVSGGALNSTHSRIDMQFGTRIHMDPTHIVLG